MKQMGRSKIEGTEKEAHWMAVGMKSWKKVRPAPDGKPEKIYIAIEYNITLIKRGQLRIVFVLENCCLCHLHLYTSIIECCIMYL